MDWVIRILGRIPLAKRLVGLLFQRHLHQRASVVLVAEELEYNAAQMDSGHSPVSKYNYVFFTAWEANNRDIHLRLRGDPELWQAVSGAYADLRRLSHGASPPSGDHLRQVAERIRATLN